MALLARPAAVALACFLSPSLAFAAAAAHAAAGGEALALSAETLESAGVTLARVEPGEIAQTLSAPGVVTVDSDRVARAPARVSGVIAELRKRLGDLTVKGEIIAVIDSREVADAKAEWQAARVAEGLQAELFARAEKLWDKRISAEQAFLQAGAAAATARLRLNLARQKLLSLGVEAAEIDALRDDRPSVGLGLYPVRAPIDGRVIERKVDVGAAVGGLNDPSELYILADLDRVWLELSIPVSALEGVAEGQALSLRAPDGRKLDGQIIFVSPTLTAETRAARVLAAVDNPALSLRPGGFVSAVITLGQSRAALRAPKTAVQMIEGRPSLFVRGADGFFVARPVALGRADDQFVEILSGVAAGETIAAQNSFVLKAELGKAEAGHAE